MAKKKEPTVPITAKKKRKGIAVRLDLRPDDVKRLEQQAEKRGLNKASTARMAVLAWLDEQEGAR